MNHATRPSIQRVSNPCESMLRYTFRCDPIATAGYGFCAFYLNLRDFSAFVLEQKREDIRKAFLDYFVLCATPDHTRPFFEELTGARRHDTLTFAFQCLLLSNADLTYLKAKCKYEDRQDDQTIPDEDFDLLVDTCETCGHRLSDAQYALSMMETDTALCAHCLAEIRV